MDHELVLREKLTEKYFLEELDPELLDKFEEHYFECTECARDVRAASVFVNHSKAILAEQGEPRTFPMRPPAHSQGSSGWFAWLRPAVLIPVMAILIAVISYQNFVTLPRLSQQAGRPQLLPAATLNLLTYGTNASPLVVHGKEGFLLNVIVPPGQLYPSYRVHLYGPAGNMDASVPIKASTDDTWPIRFPAATRQSGTYKVAVHGLTSDGKDVLIGSNSFELQVEK